MVVSKKDSRFTWKPGDIRWNDPELNPRSSAQKLTDRIRTPTAVVKTTPKRG